MDYQPRSLVTARESCLPGCCGVNVVHGAQYQDRESLKAAFEELIASGGELDWEGSGQPRNGRRRRQSGHPGLLLYSVSDEDAQQTTISEVLIELGFEALTSFVSPRSDNTVTIYGLKVNQPRAAARRARRR